jgi:hypothetical protein
MNKPCLAFAVALPLAFAVMPTQAQQDESVYSPEPGVLCDSYVCASDKGISRGLTARYLGKLATKRLFAQGEFNLGQFTFANGVFCDVNERLCRVDRYFDAKGQRSAVSTKYTNLLFTDK